MNKFKFLLVGLLTVVLGSAIAVGVLEREVTPVHAADTPTTKWAAIGTINGTSWNQDFGFTYDEVDDRFEFTSDFAAGNEFKLRYNGGWNKEIGYTSEMDSATLAFISNSGGNMKIKETGNYTLTLDKGIEGWTYNYYYGFHIYKNEEVAHPSFITGTTLYVLTNDNYVAAGAIIKAKFANEGTDSTVVETTKITGNYFSFVVPEGEWTKVSIQRINPSNSTNVWNESGIARYSEDHNLLTMDPSGWTGASLTWGVYEVIPTHTPFAVGTTLYVLTNNNYVAADAVIKAHFGNEDSGSVVVETTNITGNYFSFVVPEGEWTKVSIQRIDPSDATNVWNESAIARYSEGHDLLTMDQGDVWDGAALTWGTYEAPDIYTITYVDPADETTLGEAEITEGTSWNSAFFEREEYRLEGWYTDKELTTEYTKGTTPTSDLTLYANYVEAEDYTILIPEDFFGVSSSKNPVMNIYMWRDALDGGTNAAWPGEALTSCTKIDYYYLFTVDASKSYDKLILNVNFNGRDAETFKDQFETVSTPLGTEEYKVYQVGSASGTDKRSCSVSHNEYSLAALVYELGGAWGENTTDRTPKCEANYDAAKAMFLSLPAEVQEAFKTAATDTDLEQARDRYVNWCTANGDLTPFEPTSSGYRNNLISVFNNDKNYLIATIIVLISVTALAILIIKKRKSAEQ